jgi:hypothetical protein
MFFSFSVCDTLSTSNGGVIWWKNWINTEVIWKRHLHFCTYLIMCDIQYSTHNLRLSSGMWHCISGQEVHETVKYLSTFTARAQHSWKILLGQQVIWGWRHYVPSQHRKPLSPKCTITYQNTWKFGNTTVNPQSRMQLACHVHRC